jgi:small-conductance mechanosensitive channel
MNTQQKILQDIFEAFEKENIQFAYPTQTLFLKPEFKDENKKQTASSETLQ